MTPRGDSGFRVRFHALVTFANGGDMTLNDFMFDWPGATCDPDDLKRMVVHELGLLMVHTIDLRHYEVVSGAHKGVRAASSPREPHRRVTGPEVVEGHPPDHAEVLGAAFLQLSGYEPDALSELTVYGAWSGQPCLLVQGGEGVDLPDHVVRRLNREGLRLIVSDTDWRADGLATVRAPSLTRESSSALTAVGVAHIEGRMCVFGIEDDSTTEGWSGR